MRIIVWKDKYAAKYYDATTLEAWDASCIEILKELTEERYGYMDPESVKPYITDKQRELAAVTQDPHTMPEQFRDLVLSARATIQHEERQYEYAKQQYKIALKYVADGTSGSVTYGKRTQPKAWSIIQERTGLEYEDFSLEDVFTVREDT